jgi:probable F420-dependent oxidoreductase
VKSGIYLIESANGVSPAAASLSDPAYLAAVAREAEAAGLDSVWIPDHVVIPVEYRSRYPYQSYDGDAFERYPWDETAFPEPVTALAFVAAVTERVELCTGVVILPERNPVFLAKQCATVDRLSGGRLRLGVGIGWLREEFDAVGVPWERRGRRTDEAIEAMRALWTQDEASYQGETVSFERIRCRPAPVAPGGVPIIVGGHSDASARRAGRLGDGFLPIVASGDSFAQETRHRLDVMRAAAEEAGRDPDGIEISGFGSEDPAGLEAQREAGFDHVFHFVCEPDLDAARRRIEAIAAVHA